MTLALMLSPATHVIPCYTYKLQLSFDVIHACHVQLPTGSILPLNQITTITTLPVVQPVLNRCARDDISHVSESSSLLLPASLQMTKPYRASIAGCASAASSLWLMPSDLEACWAVCYSSARRSWVRLHLL
jgi:hypothetical protein